MSDKAKKAKKHNSVRQYFTLPIIYVLISLAAVLPLCLVMLGVSVKTVHKVQNAYVAGIGDYSLSDGDYTPSDKKDGTVTVKRPLGFAKTGELICEKAGFNTSVYYGSNRVSYRGGAGMNTKMALPGMGKAIEISADSTGGFKALYNLEKDDIITFVTTWGVYKYKVTDITLSNAMPKSDGETLYLITAADKKAFSVFGNKKYIVSASYVSGPVVKEVQNEQ
ncbi:MAG: hypothetical protein K6C14_00745 [Eubacterium sp.]|nr:hypothetical protein [Eubacterium sp.]